MSGPLAGIRVLDFCQYANGPVATGQLADQGAEVVKIEPAVGEGQRHTSAPGYGNAMLEVGSRGKKAMTLDLRHPGAMIVVERLCQWADVLAENFRPGVLEKLGLGYEALRKFNPRLIYASNSGLGSKGEWATRPSYDGIGQAFAGVLTANGGGVSHTPRELPFVFSDIVGANNFYAGILAALVARGRTGEGQHVVTSQTAAALFFQQAELWGAFNNGIGQDDSGKTPWQQSPWQQLQRAADGHWLVISMIQRRQFEQFCCDAVKRRDLMTSRIMKRWPGALPDDWAWLHAEIAGEIRKRPQEHWLRVLREADVPCSPVASYADIGDPTHLVGKHLRDNGYVGTARHREYGQIKIAAPPVSFSGTPNSLASDRPSVHAPHIGEHNAEMLRTLGFSDAEASQLGRDGVVPAPTGPHEQAVSQSGRRRYVQRVAEKVAELESKSRAKL